LRRYDTKGKKMTGEGTIEKRKSSQANNKALDSLKML
jgi:hypothetical protein